jgi:transcriptional regulator with XRE-family HTH domain
MRERRVSAQELSHGIGVSPSTVSKWVNNPDREPSAEMLLKVARFFGVSVEYLICGEHPEIEAMRGFAAALESNFVQLHQGVYRITVEKQLSTDKKFKDGKK